MQHTLWYINLPSMHEHVVKFPYARSSGEPKHTTANFFSLFLHLSAVPKNSTQGKFAYICHFQRIGIINVTKFEKTRIHFVTFLLPSPPPSPSSMLKLPIHIYGFCPKRTDTNGYFRRWSSE